MLRFTRIRVASVIGIAVVTAAGALLGVHLTQSSNLRPIDDFQSPAMGIAFRQLGPSAAMSPALPNGSPALTRSQALDIAGRHAMAPVDPRKISGVYYITRYGVFTDSQLHDVHTGPPKYVNRVVWIVRYYGPSVNFLADCPSRAKTCPEAHEVTVIIDAATGQHLETYIG